MLATSLRASRRPRAQRFYELELAIDEAGTVPAAVLAFGLRSTDAIRAEVTRGMEDRLRGPQEAVRQAADELRRLRELVP